MEEEGRCLRAPGGWAAPAKLKYVQGVLSVQRAGMGFVTPSAGGPDLYIHPAAMNDAWHGDTVEVLVLPGKRGPSAEGRITKVLRRALREEEEQKMANRKKRRSTDSASASPNTGAETAAALAAENGDEPVGHA